MTSPFLSFRILAICPLVFLTFALMNPAHGQGDLLKNGSFEDEFTGENRVNELEQEETLRTQFWSSLEGARRSDAKSRTGDYSAKVEIDQAIIDELTPRGFIFWSFLDHNQLHSQQVVRASVWVFNEIRLEPSVSAELRLSASYGDLIELATAELPKSPTKGWQQITVELKLPDDFSSDWRVRVEGAVIFRDFYDQETGAMYFDDFEAEVVSD
jgi:hypothetical protein